MKNTLLYNFGKDLYYKYMFFRGIPHKWGKKFVYTIYRGVKIRFLLYSIKGDGFHSSKYLNENLSTLHREIKGYLALRDVKEGDLILDCGAYNGAFSVYACKKAGPKGLVVCFEPDKRNAEILRKNLKANNCKNFKIIEKGLWNKPTELKFKSGGVGAMISKEGDVTINVTSLDYELNKLKIPFSKVNFVKMDIEGAEIEALDGMKKLLNQKKKPYVAIASYHIVNGEKTYKEVEKKLKKFKYKKIKSVFPGHLTTVAMQQ
jgi:FkbM family methyltransferase